MKEYKPGDIIPLAEINGMAALAEEVEDLKAENEKLKVEVANVETLITETEDLKAENEKLKKELADTAAALKKAEKSK